MEAAALTVYLESRQWCLQPGLGCRGPRTSPAWRKLGERPSLGRRRTCWCGFHCLEFPQKPKSRKFFFYFKLEETHLQTMDALGLQNVPCGRAWTLLVPTAENSDAVSLTLWNFSSRKSEPPREGIEASAEAPPSPTFRWLLSTAAPLLILWAPLRDSLHGLVPSTK